MRITIQKDRKEFTLDFKGSVRDLLGELSLNPETVVVVRDREIMTEEDQLSLEDEVTILSVISGG